MRQAALFRRVNLAILPFGQGVNDYCIIHKRDLLRVCLGARNLRLLLYVGKSHNRARNHQQKKIVKSPAASRVSRHRAPHIAEHTSYLRAIYTLQ